MRQFSIFLLLAALFCGFVVRVTQAVDAVPEFEQFAQIAQESANKQGAAILVKYDEEKRLLQIAREFKVNQFRKMTQVQSVKIDDLEMIADANSTPGLADPWLKIHCVGKKKNVQLDSTQEINNVLDEDYTKAEKTAVLTLPCYPSELNKLAEAYAKFRQSAGVARK